MQNKTKLMCLIFFILSLSAMGSQAQSIDLSGNANCDGWSALATMTFPDGVYTGTISYTVALLDQSGNEVTSFNYSNQLYRFEDPVMMNMFGESWGVILAGNYEAQFVFQFFDQETTLNFAVDCGQEIEEFNPCKYSPGFWKTNLELWPVESLLVGGISLEQNQLVHIMMDPIRGNGSLLMARELVAAKLNVANGCDNSIETSITEGDNFLVEHPLAEDLWRSSMHQTRDLRRALSVYNKTGCAEMTFDSENNLYDLQFRTAATEETTFGSLKAMYR